ncbi:hypothetical protein CALCODRAFT_504695 [Calocera cornea HHB12733]|uniref:Uncharacterized protein n=1 Tax=Calocera cornea HHB12733 TaxID=1353952 RepID=A0A165C9Y8_9BASI|nr:hypothetical protein CALCODRAFT_504695 [Calocera cornea HHB12733]
MCSIGSRERSATSVAVLPFDDQTYDFIQREFDLPEDMLKAARDDHEFITHYFHHDLKSGTRRLCLLLRLMLFDKDGCCLALSYDSTTHSTYALLLGLLDRPRAPKEELAEQLRRSASSAWHPLFLPLLLLRNRSERIALKMQYSIGSGFDVELSQAVDKGVSAQPQSNQRSGRGHSSPGRSTPKSNDRDVEAVLTRLCTMSTDIGIVQTAAELLLASLRRIEDLRDAVVKQTSTKLLMLQADEDDDFLMNVQRTNDTVERHIDYIKNANSNRIIRVAQMKENVQRQLDGVETLITHRDNKTKLWAGLR